MKLDRNELSKAVRLGLKLGAVAAVGVAGTAFAQNQTTTTTTTTQTNGQQPQTLQTIVVTGSNIRRVDLETSNPVVTIDRAQIQSSGKLTLGDIVQGLPSMTGSLLNPQVNNAGGTGGSFANMRGLGFRRTLVLIDGERIGQAPVDLNSIPADMIERVEVLNEGASAVYGSDAIGGVVNFITRKNYQGAEFSADYGISDHDDGARKGYHFVFGQTSDKGSIIGGVDYNKEEEIPASNRKFSQNSVSITGSPSTPPYSFVGGSSFPAFDRVQLTPAQAATFGCDTVALNHDASGTVTAPNQGQVVNQANYHCFTNSDKYNYAPLNLIETPQERTSGFLSGTYHLTDNIDAYLNLFHNKTSANFQLAPALYGTPSGGFISVDSYYNPFGVNFGGSSGNDFRLRLVSAGNRLAKFGTNNDSVRTGLKGNFNFPGLNQSWSWDVGYGFSHTSTSTITLGLPNQALLNADLGPSHFDPTTGTVVCDTPSAGCTPFNVFDQFDPNSVAAIQAAAAAAISSAFALERYEHADVNGGLFDLPAGTVQLAAGAAYRKEYTNSFVDPVLKVDPTTGQCTLGSQCSSPLQGGYTVKEAYAEVFVPILKDLPFAKALNLTLGDRFSKYSTFGSTSNWKTALEWRPIDDLLLRGTVTKVFRAPNVGEVFGPPIADAPLLSVDPCDHITTPGNPACVNVPTDGSFEDKDVKLHQQIQALASGSQAAGFPLSAELGKSFDWGVVYDPHFIPGLSLSADVYRIFLNDTITGVGAQTVLNLCFAGQTQFCPLITRFGAGPNQGQIKNINEPTANLGRTDTRGVDLGAHYKLPQFSFGQFNVGLDATYLAQYKQETAPGQTGNTEFNDAGHFLGFGSGGVGACQAVGGVCLFPRWRAQAFADWQLGSWDASWRMRYIGHFRAGSPDLTQNDNFVPGLLGSFKDFGATVYNDFTVGYNIEPINTKIDVGVDNVFDKQPPFLFANNTLNANTDPGDFDLIGRYYRARITVKF